MSFLTRRGSSAARGREEAGSCRAASSQPGDLVRRMFATDPDNNDDSGGGIAISRQLKQARHGSCHVRFQRSDEAISVNCGRRPPSCGDSRLIRVHANDTSHRVRTVSSTRTGKSRMSVGSAGLWLGRIRGRDADLHADGRAGAACRRQIPMPIR